MPGQVIFDELLYSLPRLVTSDGLPQRRPESLEDVTYQRKKNVFILKRHKLTNTHTWIRRLSGTIRLMPRGRCYQTNM